MSQYVTSLPQEIIDEVYAELVNIIHNPGELKLCHPDVLKRVHRNLFTYSPRALVLSSDLFERVHQDALNRLGPAEWKRLNFAYNAREAKPNTKPLAETQSHAIRENTKSKAQQIRELLAQGHSVKDVAKMLGVRYQQVYQEWKKTNK